MGLRCLDGVISGRELGRKGVGSITNRCCCLNDGTALKRCNRDPRDPRARKRVCYCTSDRSEVWNKGSVFCCCLVGAYGDRRDSLSLVVSQACDKRIVRSWGERERAEVVCSVGGRCYGANRRSSFRKSNGNARERGESGAICHNARKKAWIGSEGKVCGNRAI